MTLSSWDTVDGIELFFTTFTISPLSKVGTILVINTSSSFLVPL